MNVTEKQKQVICNIVGAVETGGQVYGKRDYSNFTEAKTNVSTEVAITIGAYQHYGVEAKRLLQYIRTKYPTVFKRLDTENIGHDLDTKDWRYYGYDTAYGKASILKKSPKAKCIQTIIGSIEGVKCQDELVIQQFSDYMEHARKLGVSNIDAQIMCANFEHQGGSKAPERILAKTVKPYTLDNIYKACQSDTGNQVGAYKTRQLKVYTWLKNELSSLNDNKGGNEMSVIEQVRKDAVDFAVKIANDNTHGYSQAVRSLYNITTPKSFDCSSLVCTAYYYAFVKNGLTKAASYLKAHCSYTGNMLNMLNCGFEIVARNQTAHAQMILGDIELNETHHTALAIDSNNIVHARSSEGTSNTIDDSGNEIRTQPWYLYSHGWTHRLRFTGKGLDLTNLTPSTPTVPSSSSPTKTFNKTRKWIGVVTASSLNVRKGAGTENGFCSFSPLKKNTEVDVCDSITVSGEIWYYIKFNGKYGFVCGKYIKKKTSSSSASWVGEVTASELNVRTKAGINNPILAAYPKLKKGNKIRVLSTLKANDESQWHKIAINNTLTNNKDIIGFVSANYIRKV